MHYLIAAAGIGISFMGWVTYVTTGRNVVNHRRTSAWVTIIGYVLLCIAAFN